jgi:beta-glucanase (GH16 family)
VTIDPKNLSATATLTFSDEFNTLSLWNGSSGTWTTKYPFSPENGGTLDGNGEQEWYINAMHAPTDAINPWTVSNGVLTLTAQPAPASIQPLINGYDYTSGLITTSNTFSQKYGYFEMRADLPAGQGLWPAFWLLQADGSWPPEIDVMEVLGHDVTTLHGGVHTNETGGHTSRGAATKVPDMSAGYHTYGVDWQADYVTIYFDGNQVYKTATPADMHEPMYMLANLAVGGHWPGMVNSTTPFPAEMKIDYIRAYADKGAAPPSSPPVQPPVQEPTNDAPRNVNRGTRRDDTRDGSDGSDTDTPNDTIRGPRRDHTRDGRDQPDTTPDDATPRDTIRGSRRDDTRDVRDGFDTDTTPNDSIRGTRRDHTSDTTLSDTLRGTRTDDSHDSRGASDRLSHNDANLLTGGAGSDVFTFDRRATVQGDRITDATDTGARDARPLFNSIDDQGASRVADDYSSFPSDRAGSARFDSDADAAGTSHQSPWVTGALDNVQPTGLHLQTDWFLH